MNANQREAVERLIAIALKNTGQSTHVANFLLSWWNADAFGGFKITSCWSCDRAIVDDIETIFQYLVRDRSPAYPDTLGYGQQFQTIIKMWRPNVCKNTEDQQ